MENGSERKEYMCWFSPLNSRFVRRITLKENATQDEMLQAFEIFKQLIYRDERVSYKDVLALIHNMITSFEWDYYMYGSFGRSLTRSYSQMLNILFEYRGFETSFEVILKMREKFPHISIDDYKLAIRTCSLCANASQAAHSLWNMMLSEGYSPKVVDFETLMQCYVKSKAFSEAEKLFDQIREHGLEPTVWTYNILINGYNKSGSWERALQIYQIMKLAGVRPDGITCTTLIDLLLKTKQPQYVHVILKDLQGGENLVDQIVQSLRSSDSRGDSALWVLDEWEKVFSAPGLRELSDRFDQLHLRKTSLNALLLWYVQQSDDLAVQVLYHATQRLGKARPDDLTYKLLLWHCARQRNGQLFQRIMTNATQQGVQYNVETGKRGEA